VDVDGAKFVGEAMASKHPSVINWSSITSSSHHHHHHHHGAGGGLA